MAGARFGVAIAVAGLLVTAGPARADVKTQEKTQVKFEGMLGRMMGLFAGKSAKEGIVQTVVVKGDRKATMADDTGTIVDLAEEKVYEVNLKDRSYKVVTFAEMRKKLEEARRKAEEDARKAEARDKKDGREMEVDFNVRETGQTKEIAGYSCHQVIATIGVHEKGQKLDQAGGILMTSDIWMAPAIPAMKEISEFEVRYMQKLAVDAPGADMAQAMAMYPGLKDAMAKFRAESVKMAGTPIQTITTFQNVLTAEQAAQAKRRDDEKASSPGGTLGGMLGRFGRKKTEDKPKEPAVAQASAAPAGDNVTTIMTSRSEVLNVSTSVSASDLQIPAGFRQK